MPMSSLIVRHKFGGRGSVVHEIGGLYTYAKRYVLCSLLGIAGDEDLDGNLNEEIV